MCGTIASAHRRFIIKKGMVCINVAGGRWQMDINHFFTIRGNSEVGLQLTSSEIVLYVADYRMPLLGASCSLTVRAGLFPGPESVSKSL